MKGRSPLVRMSLVIAVAGLAQASCSATGNHQFTAAATGSGGGNGAGGGSVVGAGTTGAGASPGFDAGSGVSCSGPHCSSDLHSMVDCNGNVLSTCPPNQGCTPTGCVDACAAAIANQSNVGCEYYAVTPDVIVGGNGACYAAYIANTWTTPVTVQADFGGMMLDPSTFAYIPTGTGQSLTYTPIQNGQIPPGKVAILFLNVVKSVVFPGHNLNCPKGVTVAIDGTSTTTHGTGLGKAFHLTASAPVVAYDMYPYGGGQTAMTSGTLLLPTSAWDTNYIAVDAFGSSPVSPPFVQLVAMSDGTNVTINPVAAIKGGPGVAAAAAGTPTTYPLSQGQVLQFTQAASLGGSVIQSDKPIGAWGGATVLAIQACCDDTAHQQIPPVRALGNEYALVRYRNRYPQHDETPPWRLVGAVDGTVLTWEPSTPTGAPTSLSLGQVAQFSGAGPYIVSSQDAQHPFYVSAHMTGGGVYDPNPNGNGDGRGDAEFVNVIPPAEYMDKYVFFTDPTYSETDLVLVRARGPSGFADVTLDCAGTLTGWQPVGSSGKFEYTRIDLVSGNFQPQGNCNNGRHEIQSPLPFGLTVWGWGSAATGDMAKGIYTQYVSYAYPAGAGVQPINTVVVAPTTK
jgi:hypothetical protein